MGSLVMPAGSWGAYRPTGWKEFLLSMHRAKSKRVRKLAKRGLGTIGDVIDVSRFGLKMRCHVLDNLTEHDIVFGGKYDNAAELALIEAHLQPGGIFVDVGANCGVYSLTAARKVGSRGRVIAIEANPAMVERLAFNVDANGFENVEIVGCAIGDSAGTADLSLCAGELGQSSLAAPVAGPTISVPVEPLCSVLGRLGIERIDAMKVDIEGFEDRAIMPMLRTAPERLWPRAIMVEKCHAYLWRDGCIVALQDAGYKIEWQSWSDILLTR